MRHRIFAGLLGLVLAAGHAGFAGESSGGYAAAQALIPDGITLSPTVTVMDGETHEYVYFEDKHLSELIWDLKPLVLYGAALGLEWNEGLALRFAGSAARPGNTGAMRDMDWLNLLTDGSGDLTHLAEGDANLRYAYAADARADWRIRLPVSGPRGSGISLSPGIGFRYMIWSWDADDGYTQYADNPTSPTGPGGTYRLWTEGVPKKPFAGTAISYLQEWWMPEISLGLNFDLDERVSVGFSARGSAWVFCSGVDHHYANLGGIPQEFSTDTWTMYYDQLSGGWLFEPGASATLRATNRVAFRFEYSRVFTSTLRGNTYEQSSNSDAVTESLKSGGSGGGAMLDASKVTVSAILRLR